MGLWGQELPTGNQGPSVGIWSSGRNLSSEVSFHSCSMSLVTPCSRNS